MPARAAAVCGTLLFAVAVAAWAADQPADPSAFTLSDRCPPSFEQTDAGRCQLRTLYEFYSSVQDKGLGGTQTALPAHRDGFTPQQIDLGRYLFFDPLLSADGTVACASCHRPDRGFSDGLPRSVGIGGQQVGRAAPSLWNAAYLTSFFWDARAHSLEEQMLGPLFAADEMGNTPETLLAALNGNASYRALFRQAFPGAGSDGTPGEMPDKILGAMSGEMSGAMSGETSGETSGAMSDAARTQITLEQTYLALAAFQSSLISLNSRYDRYAHGFHAALTPPEIEGLNVFRSFVARCAECHTPPLFTNQQVAVIGAPEPVGLPLDIGAERTYAAPKLRAGFKVPTLRNIARTGPYMHSGLFANLRDTVGFYNGGRGHAVPAEVDLHLHWHITSPDLTDYELDRLVDFLGALTDESLSPPVPEQLPSGLPPVVQPAATRTAATPSSTGDST